MTPPPALLPRPLDGLLRHASYPLLLGGAVATVLLGLEAGLDRTALVSGVALSAGALLLGLERLIPYSPRWRVGLRERVVRTDLLHTLISSAGTAALLDALALGLAVALAAWLAQRVGAQLWPGAWPLLAQLALALLLGELGATLGHRLCHRVPLLWRIHAMHHSAERMHLLTSGRNHPFNVTLTFAVQNVPLVALGAGGEVLALHAAFTAVQGLCQHCNVDFRARAFEWLLATPDLHRRHHARDLREGNTNFGNNLVVWDLLLGTRYAPAGRPSDAVGIEGLAVPEGWLGQLALPFTYEQRLGDQAAPPPPGAEAGLGLAPNRRHADETAIPEVIAT